MTDQPIQPIHLRPECDLAPRVLLPGHPGRALHLATALLGDDRRMFNHHRGLWGYTGTAADGARLTVQSTGMGAPSAAIVLEELADLGAELAIRVGTCSALDGSAEPGDLVAVEAALAGDGVSRALGAPERVVLDGGLTRALARASGRPAAVVASTDLFYGGDPGRHAAGGAALLDLETAALATVAARRGVRFGCILAVAAVGEERLDDERFEAAGVAAGRAAADVLVGVRATEPR